MLCGEGQQTGQGEGGRQKPGVVRLGGGQGTHFSLVDKQHHVGEGVQGHVHRQLHRARMADAAPDSRP